jgi:N-alpha-acetyltransferase 40
MSPDDAELFVNAINARPHEQLRQSIAKTVVSSQLRYKRTTLQIEAVRSQDLEMEDFGGCFDLIVETSAAAYKSSTKGWKPRSKKEEMREPDMWYLLLREKAHVPVQGFASFMITIEDDFPVVYLYEIHLSEPLRGKGVGDMLMDAVESVGRHFQMEKAMLTVFTSNEGAARFYRRLGYATDEYSPQPRMLRGGKLKLPDYVILSKSLKAGA